LTIGNGSSNNTLQIASNSSPSAQAGIIVATGSSLDITNNIVYINYPIGQDPISSIAALISSGYAGGAWTGPGITSSTGAANNAISANPKYGIGYADSADPNNPAGLATNQIEIMYTLMGDANLDGKVNGSDFTLMAASFNDSVTNGWDEGDFNYSGTVNGDDFVLLANNFNLFASESAVSAADLVALDSFASANGISLTAVPEPTSIGFVAVMGAALLSRRRSRRQGAKRKEVL
jgi:hypothetical protein